MKKYVFRRYNKKFRKLFKEEKIKLINLLKENVQVEHVGSTAVQNLGGKGIIDIIIGADKEDIENIKEKLQDSGYDWIEASGEKDRIFFQRDYGLIFKRRVHLHLTTKNSKVWKSTISVRNYLRTHPKEIKEYEKIKKEAVKYAKGEGKKYREYKNKFLSRIAKISR